jgi:protein-L-isoaspartate(D-aspartate) O-methyltransferase
MVRDQLVPRGIKNERVLDAMRRVPRQMFVGKHLKKMAYDDYPLLIGEEQTISQPYMVAAMTEALEPYGEDRVLEIGTGSGYQTAILAELVQEVFTVERISSLAHKASEVLLGLGYSNIHFKTGDGTRGWSEHAPFDKTLVTAGSPGVPKELFRQLRNSGRMVIPIGDTFSQVLTIVVKRGEELKKEKLFSCIFVPLVGENGWGDFIGA